MLALIVCIERMVLTVCRYAGMLCIDHIDVIDIVYAHGFGMVYVHDFDMGYTHGFDIDA